MSEGQKLHGSITDTAGQFRADCWLVDASAAIVAGRQVSKSFPTLEAARAWLEQQSHQRGFDRIWMER